MSYIIVWRNNHREPFLETSDHGFLQTFENEEDAIEHAKSIIAVESKDSPYHNYVIYKESIYKTGRG